MNAPVLEDLIQSHKRLAVALEALPFDVTIGEWTKKEIAAHCAGWYEEGIAAIPLILKGENPLSFQMSMNSFNKRSITKRQDQTVEATLREM